MKQEVKSISISNDSLISDFQRLFSMHYPYLKIEFLQIDPTAKQIKSVILDSTTSLNQLKSIGFTKNININNEITIRELSHELENILGVIVQVFRKSGNVWNVISLTNEWTLENQNAAGLYISSKMHIPLN